MGVCGHLADSLRTDLDQQGGPDRCCEHLPRPRPIHLTREEIDREHHSTTRTPPRHRRTARLVGAVRHSPTIARSTGRRAARDPGRVRRVRRHQRRRVSLVQQHGVGRTADTIQARPLTWPAARPWARPRHPQPRRRTPCHACCPAPRSPPRRSASSAPRLSSPRPVGHPTPANLLGRSPRPPRSRR